MPIRPRLRWCYPIDWPQISSAVRFFRAKGRCEKCRRPHGCIVRQFADGRWHDVEAGCWRDDLGQPVDDPPWNDVRWTVARRVILATAHLDQDPRNNSPTNLAALCGRCHLAHDRAAHRVQRRITLRQRRAVGDLFEGPYDLL